MIKRQLIEHITPWLNQGKVIIIYGARQVGKTTLSKTIASSYPQHLYWDGELPSVQQLLESKEPSRHKRAINDCPCIIIDEGQKINNIGTILKILHDHLPETQIIVTGSASFELQSKLSEPLTGRHIDFLLTPLSIGEMVNHQGLLNTQGLLPMYLQYGLYPDIVLHPEAQAIPLLQHLASDYLYKDILILEHIRKPSFIVKLLQLLAFQIGSEVSFSKLSQELGITITTVQKYVDILEKAFVIFVLRGFSKNLRSEVTRSVKIYFWDIGIRNMLIQQLNPVHLRTDIGAVWENFCIVERKKYCMNHNIYHQSYFRRTVDQQEVDYLEISNDTMKAFEWKWNKSKTTRPKVFLDAYPEADYTLINQENIWDIL